MSSAGTFSGFSSLNDSQSGGSKYVSVAYMPVNNGQRRRSSVAGDTRRRGSGSIGSTREFVITATTSPPPQPELNASTASDSKLVTSHGSYGLRRKSSFKVFAFSDSDRTLTTADVDGLRPPSPVQQQRVSFKDDDDDALTPRNSDVTLTSNGNEGYKRADVTLTPRNGERALTVKNVRIKEALLPFPVSGRRRSSGL